VADSLAEADISLRLGEPDFLVTPAYQVDTEEVLVVTHRQSPLQNMAVEEVRELFAGQGGPSVQVWVYAAGEDVQGVFEQVVMQGRSITSSARLAISPQHMSDTLNNEPNSVGILPRRWRAGDARFIYTIPDVPVLALVTSAPQGAIQAIIACLQKSN
jgi:phosphate transport system substrate-binding protein